MKRFPFISSTLAIVAMCAGVLAQSSSATPGDAERRVESILGKMSLEEKIDMIGGVDGFFIRDIPRLGIRRLKMADGPLGVRNFGPATAMAGGIALAATWNPELAQRLGTELGRDARAKGVHFLLGPGVNIYRAPMNGRNFEYLGEDPFLASRLAVGYIKGVQSQGVSATIKHFMGNNSEFDRHNSDSVIDERTMREIYLPVFEAAVKEAHVGAVMDSYNLTNGAHMSENSFLNSDVLKKEWGFSGILMSDWSSTYNGVAAANSGLDLEMPYAAYMNRSTLLPAIQAGQVQAATIDDKVRRILRTAAQFGWLDRDQTELSIPRFNEEGRKVALQAARESMVLLKNDGGLLPWAQDQIASVAVIGPNAYPATPVGGGSARVEPFAAVSLLEGIGNYLSTQARTYYNHGVPSLSDMAEATRFFTAASNGEPGLNAEYFDNPDLQGSPMLQRVDRHVSFGLATRTSLPETAASARWTGYYVPERPGLFDIFAGSTGEDGGFFRLYVDGKLIFDNWKSSRSLVPSASLSLDAQPHKVVFEHWGRSRWLGSRLNLGIIRHDGVVDPEALKLAAQAGAVVLAVGFDPESESEGGDRTFRLPPGQEELIQEIAAVNQHTVVVMTSGGAVDMSAWIDRVPAVLQAWYPGQEGGSALAEILFGAVNPSGRLPVSFERREEDNPTHDSYYPQDGGARVVYKEGVFVGYRGYRNGKEPLFPFGYGLSYTTFAYSNLSISPAHDGAPMFLVSFDVTNTGKRAGAEVAQVYVGDRHAKVPRPEKELKGFAKVELRPGETRHVQVTLDQRALSYYDMETKQWRADPGDFEVLVGKSAMQVELRGKLTLGNTSRAGR